MTITEPERLHSKLSCLEDLFPGHKIEVVGGVIMMSPVRPFHGRTIRFLENAVEARLSEEWSTVSDVAFLFDDDDELCPDIAVMPEVEVAKNLSCYPPDLIEVAMEVVSPSSVRNDYETKDRLYARAGIPVYLVFDPYEAHCVMHWNPGQDGYLGRDTVPYGKTVSIETPVGRLELGTDQLPVDTRDFTRRTTD